MKKLFALTLLAFIFTMSAYSQKVPINQQLGDRPNFNPTCGPVWDYPDPVSCDEYYQLYVYYPLQLKCECEAPICLGWLYPASEYCNYTSDFACQFDLLGEGNYWFEAKGSFSNGAGGHLTSPDGFVTLSNIHWETSKDNFAADISTVPNVDGDGAFDEDFRLDGASLQGPGYGERQFRVWPGCVTTLTGAHGAYYWTATLWAQYNF